MTIDHQITWLTNNIQRGFESHEITAQEGFELLCDYFYLHGRFFEKQLKAKWQPLIQAVGDLREQCDLYSPHYAVDDDMVRLLKLLPNA